MRPSRSDDTRLVVGKGGAHVGAHLENFRLSKGRVQRIGRAQQFDRRANAHPPEIRALDHRRADHEHAVRARDDIERNAGMQQPHRALQRYLARAHQQHLAAHAAQFRQRIARRETAAIDDHDPRWRAGGDHPRRNATRRRAVRVHRAAPPSRRADRRGLPRKEQALAETSREVGLEFADARLVDALPFPRTRREAVDVAGIARRGDDESALARDAGYMARPPFDRLGAAHDHRFRRALAFAIGREHAAREPGRVAAEFGMRS